MRQPDRLDGHPPGMIRPQRDLRSDGPYLAEADPWEDFCPGLESSIRRLRLDGLRGSDDEEDSTDEMSKIQSEHIHGFAFMTGKAVKSEINLKDLSPQDRALFDAAMQKEWPSWQKFQAVEELSEDAIK